MTDEVDVTILGGGCAGLALARELSLRSHDLRIVVVEPRRSYTDDRTWCFWTRGQEVLRPASRAQWARWQFSKDGTTITHSPRDWRYHMVSSGDYYADALSVIDACDRVQLRLGTSAGAVGMQDGKCYAETSAGPLQSRLLIDTRPPTPDWRRMAPLAQVFSGMEVEVDRSVFDPQTAQIMGDLRVSNHAFAFDYILPISSSRALIEHTVFTTRPHDPALLDQTCLAKVIEVCGAQARILRQEHGCLPMGLPSLSTANGAIVYAGTPGGALRPSSGYAFRRIQKWASRCADSLVSAGTPFTGPIDAPPLAFMDRVFLNAMSGQIDAAPDIFRRIACALDGDGFARFMSEEATWVDWAKVVAALPKVKFLAATGMGLPARKPRPRPC